MTMTEDVLVVTNVEVDMGVPLGSIIEGLPGGSLPWVSLLNQFPQGRFLQAPGLEH